MPDVEETLVLVKPDGVQRGLVGNIIGRLESRGLKIVGMKFLRVDQDLAHRHYGAHEGKPFFLSLVEFITSGPVLAVVLQGENAIDLVRQTMGVTDPINAALGTIRGDLGMNIGKNLVHGSDSPESASREVALFFERSELIDWSWGLQSWITGS